jgi:hypothetical protein
MFIAFRSRCDTGATRWEVERRFADGLQNELTRRYVLECLYAEHPASKFIWEYELRQSRDLFRQL